VFIRGYQSAAVTANGSRSSTKATTITQITNYFVVFVFVVVFVPERDAVARQRASSSADFAP
jgi:hypothetical protein